jgi:hypothetical protein
MVLGKRLKRVPKGGNPLEPVVIKRTNSQFLINNTRSHGDTHPQQELEDEEKVRLENVLRVNACRELGTCPHFAAIRSRWYEACKKHFKEKPNRWGTLQIAILSRNGTPSSPELSPQEGEGAAHPMFRRKNEPKIALIRHNPNGSALTYRGE